MPSSLHSREIEGQSGAGTRLDCWKEIAGYLGRGERTVKRWETDRGLPIRRVPGGGRSSVYAFSAELDNWLKATGDVDLKPAAESFFELTSESPAPGVPPLAVKTKPSGANRDEDASADHALLVSIPDNDGDSASELRSDVEPHSLEPSKRIGRGRHVGSIAALLLAAVALSSLGLPGLRKAVAHWSPVQPQKSPAKLAKLTPVASEAEKQSARELYLRGRYEWNERTPDSLNRALDDFTQSLVHDPQYAEAYVGMADTYDLLREYSTMPEREAFSRSIVAARKAVELDDSLAEAHRALAFAEVYGTWDFVDAEKEFRRAIELNPADPVARRWYANAFAVEGRFEESLSQIDRAQELDPTSHSTLADKGIMLFNAGRAQEGIGILKEVERTAPDFRSPHYYMMGISLQTRDYPTYLKEGKKTAELSGDPVLRDIMAAAQAGYSRDGERGLLKSVYAKQREYFRENKLWAATLADTCIHMGKRQEALQLLEEAYARHEEYLITSLLSHPDVLSLKDEPRYKALVQKINFPTSTRGE